MYPYNHKRGQTIQTAASGTGTADADEREKNVIELNGTPDGLKPIDLYIIV
jgi:hypothetical protein